MPLHLTPAEMHFMEKFFDSVAGAISARMTSGSNVGEEALTFLLCEMMDENWNSSHVLSYDLAALTRDLLQCGDLHKVEVTFETHEHGKGFEGRHSYADLGIIVRYEDHIDGTFQKAILVQAKRLYKKNNGYNLSCPYSEFKHDQFAKLTELQKKFGSNAACYLFYNPLRAAFDEDSQKQIAHFETRLFNSLTDELLEEILHFPFRKGYMSHLAGLRGNRTDDNIQTYLKQQDAELSASPGVRVATLQGLAHIIDGWSDKQVPTLLDLYQRAAKEKYPRLYNAVLLRFSSFLLQGLLGCFLGETNNELIQLASGRLPENIQPDLPIRAVKHTMTVSVRSTLRQQ